MPHRLSGHAALDSLSNLAASLNAGRDKQAGDIFFIPALAREQVESLYRGDWLAKKIVDIVPYDCVREWREWQGEAGAVARVRALESRLNLRRAVQRAMVMGRLYGGGAILIGTRESDPAALASELRPEAVGEGGLAFLHPVSRWQVAATDTERDPLSPWFGEPTSYQVAAPGRGTLTLHPSRVVRFLGAPLADPGLAGADLWSDSVLTALYDAIHAVALTTTGATSLMHEAKVDVVTVPNLSEHLSNAATTAQLSARFGYAASIKSLNNLLLLGDGETWTRQSIDFAGLPEMVRTFLQIAAGAADIPVTRLLGQSPAGLSATGDSDIRNYYDMIAARQEIDLRPQLERLDHFVLAAAGVDPGTLRFTFRPLWQMDAATKAATALQKAQATQIYAGLGLWPTPVMAGLVAGQLAEDGLYPDAGAAFEAAADSPQPVEDYSPDQPRDPGGRWTEGGGGAAPATEEPGWLSTLKQIVGALNPIASAKAGEIDPEKKREQEGTGGAPDPTEEALKPSLRPILGPQLWSLAGSTSLTPAGGTMSPPSSLSAPKLPPAPPPLSARPSIGPTLLARPGYPDAGSRPSTSIAIEDLPQSTWTLDKWSLEAAPPGILSPGPFARYCIPAGPSASPSTEQQSFINWLGNQFGCHTCGTRVSGLQSGNWIGDHLPVSKLIVPGRQQYYFPQCETHSRQQGGFVRAMRKTMP